MSNHLGNVLAVITDEKLWSDSLGGYIASVVSATDYEPFGLVLEGRSLRNGGYRWGFNGQEKDDDAAEDSYTAEFWHYSPATGRRWNVDPVVAEWESPYATFRNNPVLLNDPKGDFPIVIPAIVAIIEAAKVAVVAATAVVTYVILDRVMDEVKTTPTIFDPYNKVQPKPKPKQDEPDANNKDKPVPVIETSTETDEENEEYIYRAMAMDADGKPDVPPTGTPLDEVVSKQLGARTQDVVGLRSPEDSNVLVGGIDAIDKGGMSATPTPVQVSGPIIKDLAKGKRVLFKIKKEHLATAGLQWDRDKPNHVSIQPASKMTVEEFQKRIRSTRANWEIHNDKKSDNSINLPPLD